MSLKNKNALVPAGGKKEGLGGTLQRAAGAVAKPDGRAAGAITRAMTSGALSVVPQEGRIAFIVDATFSRAACWRDAQSVQAAMFAQVAKTGTMQLRLIHFGGNEVTDHGWSSDSEAIGQAMGKVVCVSGQTMIFDGFSRVTADDPATRAKTLILVGDSFEEEEQGVAAWAAKLKAAGVRVFAFLDGNDSRAEAAFKKLAAGTGGVFAAFGDDLPLRDLCEAVAAVSTGGAAALHRLRDSAAKTLLLTLKP